ncbi:MAG: Type 1 glutamine amidotransferase-like domain-containing protein [Anaerolineales bacterium]|nr:Type 1 glutamine amidotransferase-like domain-containing protein [Anaerolineales bacterium]
MKALAVVDQESANDPRWEGDLLNADLIYFSGGNPIYLYQTLQGSRVWAAVRQACDCGAIFSGCLAGAMVLAAQVPDIRSAGLYHIQAFGILPANGCPSF